MFQVVDKYPKPDIRIRLAQATHALNTNLFTGQQWGGLQKGYRYHLFLEFNATVTPTATVPPIVIPPDFLLKVIANIDCTIPEMQKLEKAFSGEQWAIFHRCRGILGQVHPNFSPNADLLLSDGNAQEVFLRIPLYVPDPFAPRFDECGLYEGMLNPTCSIGVQTVASLASLTTGNSMALDALAGEWSVWAYGYRTKKLVVAPMQSFDYQDVTTQGVDFFHKDDAVRFLTAYGVTNADLVYPQGNLNGGVRDNFLIDGVSPFDTNDTNRGIAFQKIAYSRQDKFDTKVKNYAATGIVADTPVLNGIVPCAFPVHSYDGGSLPTIPWIDNENTFGVQPFPKSSLKLTPQSACRVYLERLKYPTAERLNGVARSCRVSTAQWKKLGADSSPWKGEGDNWIGPMQATVRM